MHVGVRVCKCDVVYGVKFHIQTRSNFLFQIGQTIPMPVPASCNDITQDEAIRGHVIIVRYDRIFYVPHTWKSNVTKI